MTDFGEDVDSEATYLNLNVYIGVAYRSLAA
jgi:hypothetical protein